MKKESLEKARELIHEVLMNSKISDLDKYELLLNLTLFLRDYDENIKVLRKKP